MSHERKKRLHQSAWRSICHYLKEPELGFQLISLFRPVAAELHRRGMARLAFSIEDAMELIKVKRSAPAKKKRRIEQAIAGTNNLLSFRRVGLGILMPYCEMATPAQECHTGRCALVAFRFVGGQAHSSGTAPIKQASWLGAQWECEQNYSEYACRVGYYLVVQTIYLTPRMSLIRAGAATLCLTVALAPETY